MDKKKIISIAILAIIIVAVVVLIVALQSDDGKKNISTNTEHVSNEFNSESSTIDISNQSEETTYPEYVDEGKGDNYAFDTFTDKADENGSNSMKNNDSSNNGKDKNDNKTNNKSNSSKNNSNNDINSNTNASNGNTSDDNSNVNEVNKGETDSGNTEITTDESDGVWSDFY